MQYRVRRAKLKDIPRILELLVQVDLVHHRGRPDIFKGPATKYNARELEMILTDDSTPVFVCVDEAARGQHIGTMLYEHVAAYAREQHFYNITLNVWECNPGARQFYASLGLLPRKTEMETIL